MPTQSDSERHLREAENGSVADELAFASWPEEMQRVARVAVYNDILEPAIEEALQDGRKEMLDEVMKEFRGVPKAIVERAKNHLRPLLPEARAGHFTLPDKLDELAKILEEYPDELAVDA